MQERDYDAEVRQAITRLDRGQRSAGLRILESAIAINPDRFEAHHLKAMTLRLMGPEYYEESAATFVKAESSAPWVFDQARIIRDHGQLEMDRGNLELAHERFAKSIELLLERHADDKVGIELEVSRSFMGLLLCNQGNTREGLELLRNAVDKLRGHEPYELNARIRLMKAEGRLRRLLAFGRTMLLALKAKHAERCLEAIALAIGGPRLHKHLAPMGKHVGKRLHAVNHMLLLARKHMRR